MARLGEVIHRSIRKGLFTKVCTGWREGGGRGRMRRPKVRKSGEALATHRPAGGREGALTGTLVRAGPTGAGHQAGARAKAGERIPPRSFLPPPPVSCWLAPPVGQTQLETRGQIRPVLCSSP